MAGEQIEPEPPALVLEAGLVREQRGRKRLAHVFRLDQSRGGIDSADLAHRQCRAEALVVESAQAGRVVASVRIPVAVKAGEACGGEDFVHRSPVGDPRVPLRHRARVPGELARKLRVQQARVPGTAAVVQKCRDRADAELAQARKPAILDVPAARLDVLPEDRLAERTDAQRRESIEVLDSRVMAVAPDLVVPPVAHTVHRAFHAAPELQRFQAVFPSASARVCPSILEYSERACATT